MVTNLVETRGPFDLIQQLNLKTPTPLRNIIRQSNALHVAFVNKRYYSQASLLPLLTEV